MIQGESYSIGILFNSDYDKSRIEDMELCVGNVVVARLDDISLVDGMYRCELSSEKTKELCVGRRQVTLHLQDRIMGVVKQIVATIEIKPSYSKKTSQSTNSGLNLLVEVKIDETVVVENVTLANILKGEDGKDFTYEDFTAEQIEEFKRPAVEAATAVQTELSNLATLKTETAQAVENANTATSNANAAAENAAEKAELAQTATTDATAKITEVDGKLQEIDTATSNANTATENATLATANVEAAISNAATQADYAREQGEYAQAQGNTAKAKADEATNTLTQANQVKAELEEYKGNLEELKDVGSMVAEYVVPENEFEFPEIVDINLENFVVEFAEEHNAESKLNKIVFFIPKSNDLNNYPFSINNGGKQFRVVEIISPKKLRLANGINNTYTCTYNGDNPLSGCILVAPSMRLSLKIPECKEIMIEINGYFTQNYNYININNKIINSYYLIYASGGLLASHLNYGTYFAKITQRNGSLYCYYGNNSILVNNADFKRLVPYSERRFRVTDFGAEQIINSLSFSCAPLVKGTVIRVYKLR